MRHREQAEEIEILEEKIRTVKSEVEAVEVPQDFPDIDKLKTQVEEAVQKKEELEKELRALELEKMKATEDFKEYKENYPIR